PRLLSLYPSCQQQDDQDDQDQAGTAARVVAPAAAVWPCRQGTNQDQDEDDQQNSAQHGSSPGWLAEVFLRERPVRELLQPVLHVIRPAILVIEVVSVLPHVAGQQRRLAVRDRRVGVRGGDDLELAARTLHQPGPAAAELADGRLLEGLVEFLDAAEARLDRVGDLAGGRAALRGHALPVEVVVPDLTGVVEDALFLVVAGRLLDDPLQVHVLVRRAADHLVQIVDVGLVMLVVVERDRLGGNHRVEGALIVGKLWEGKRGFWIVQWHDLLLCFPGTQAKRRRGEDVPAAQPPKKTGR